MDDFDDFELDDDVDLGDIPDSGDPPPARYLCSIAKMDLRSRKDDDSKKFFSIQFKIEDVLDENLSNFIGRSVFDIFNVGRDSLWKIKGLITACRGKDAATGNRIPNLTGDFVVLDTFEDEWKGRVNLRTKGYKSPSDWVGVTKDMTDVDSGDPSPDPVPHSAAEVEI